MIWTTQRCMLPLTVNFFMGFCKFFGIEFWLRICRPSRIWKIWQLAAEIFRNLANPHATVKIY